MFYEFLDQWLQQDKNEKYKKYVENLERYNQKKQPYSKLPKDRDLIFKKD
jgi:hypothetical protein